MVIGEAMRLVGNGFVELIVLKKYVANQDNINKFCYDNQKNTFLDKNPADLYKCLIPKELEIVSSLNLNTKLPLNNNVSYRSKKTYNDI